jgi:hypothetical protein
VRPTRQATVVAFVALLGATAAPSGAAAPDPLDAAAVDVYRETLPTARGAVVAGGRETLAPLPPQAVRRLRQAGPSAAPLERVARSSMFGAPAPESRLDSVPPTSATGDDWSPEAGASAVVEAARGDRVGLLGLVLLLVTAGLTVVRLRRSTAARRAEGQHREPSMVLPGPDDAPTALDRI